MEEGFFFESAGDHLYGFYHPPRGSERRFGFVFCSPFIEEKVRTQRMMVNYARKLADLGYAVLRFDYRGYGDSQGDFEEATPATQVRDTLSALEVLRERTGVSATGILGARLGATIGFLASLEDTSVSRLVLWDPVIDVKAYVYRCLRANLSTQTIRYKKVLYNRDKLVEKIMAGEKVNIDGYLIARPFYSEAEKINLMDELSRVSAAVLTVGLVPKEMVREPSLEDFYRGLQEQAGTSTLLTAGDNFSWEGQRYYNPEPSELFDVTTDWITRHCRQP